MHLKYKSTESQKQNNSDSLWGRKTYHIWPQYVTDEFQTYKHKEMKKEAESERETGSFYTDRCATLAGPFEKHPFP